jgi:hypothetical protein
MYSPFANVQVCARCCINSEFYPGLHRQASQATDHKRSAQQPGFEQVYR